jgi:hypothetical protein
LYAIRFTLSNYTDEIASLEPPGHGRTLLDGRTLQLPLGFLNKGAYRVTEYADGASAATDPKELSTSTRMMRAGETSTIRLAPSGGYAAHLSPAKRR